MKIAPFKLERAFAEYEFKARYLLSPSDCESLSLNELLSMADKNSRELWDSLSLGYTESQGHPILLEAISRLYQSIPPEGLLVAAPEEAIFIVMNTLLKPGNQVIVLFPAYQSLYAIPEALGCDVLRWQVQAEPGGWHLDLNWLEDHISSRTRLLILNFPHNPTGYLPDHAEFNAIISMARRHGVVVLSDEMYRGLEYNPEQRLPAMADLYEMGISLNGLSKTYALPGLRLGWLATKNQEWVKDWLAFKDYTTICHSAPSEILGLIGIQNAEAIANRNLGIIQTNLRTVQAFSERHSSSFSWLEPRAGSVAFPRWIGPGPVNDLCQTAIDRFGVMILSGSIFDYPGDHFRIGLGRKNLKEALFHIEALFD